jgi:hypothetical protein
MLGPCKVLAGHTQGAFPEERNLVLSMHIHHTSFQYWYIVRIRVSSRHTSLYGSCIFISIITCIMFRYSWRNHPLASNTSAPHFRRISSLHHALLFTHSRRNDDRSQAHALVSARSKSCMYMAAHRSSQSTVSLPFVRIVLWMPDGTVIRKHREGWFARSYGCTCRFVNFARCEPASHVGMIKCLAHSCQTYLSTIYFERCYAFGQRFVIRLF